jgi:hypothetical protein
MTSLCPANKCEAVVVGIWSALYDKATQTRQMPNNGSIIQVNAAELLKFCDGAILASVVVVTPTSLD